MTTLVNNQDGSFTYTSEDGAETIYNETVTTIGLDNTSNRIDYRDETGSITSLSLCEIVDDCETVTSLAFDVVNNMLVYIDENGNTNEVPLEGLGASEMYDENVNMNTHVIASHISSDGTTTNVEETVTTLVNNQDGSFTYTSCLLYTSPSPRDLSTSRMPSSA